MCFQPRGPIGPAIFNPGLDECHGTTSYFLVRMFHPVTSASSAFSFQRFDNMARCKPLIRFKRHHHRCVPSRRKPC
jgi:hypothetical protein